MTSQISLLMFLLTLFSLCSLVRFLSAFCCSWRPQPGFYADRSNSDGREVDDTNSEPHSSIPCSPPKR